MLKEKILFVSLKYYDADSKKGLSYEYCNFYKNLKKYYSIDFLPIDKIIKKKGYNYLNNLVLKKSSKYKILFFFMYKDDFSLKTLGELKKNKEIKSIAWMSDDHWRYDIYGKNYVGYFDLIVTTCSNSFVKYKKLNQKTYLGFWATDENKITLNSKSKYNISFVGKKYGNRIKFINFLKKKNYFVKCFGLGWGNNSFFSGDIKKIFAQSLINLNFSDSSTGFTLRNILKVFLHKKTNGKYFFNNPLKYILYFKTFCLNQTKQIKGRLFEIVSSNSFVLTEYHKDLSKYFDLEREIGCFKNRIDLLKKIKFYNKNKQLMNHMKNRAYKKFKKKYTINSLFKNILTEAYK